MDMGNFDSSPTIFQRGLYESSVMDAKTLTISLIIAFLILCNMNSNRLLCFGDESETSTNTSAVKNETDINNLGKLNITLAQSNSGSGEKIEDSTSSCMRRLASKRRYLGREEPLNCWNMDCATDPTGKTKPLQQRLKTNESKTAGKCSKTKIKCTNTNSLCFGFWGDADNSDAAVSDSEPVDVLHNNDNYAFNKKGCMSHKDICRAASLNTAPRLNSVKNNASQTLKPRSSSSLGTSHVRHRCFGQTTGYIYENQEKPSGKKLWSGNFCFCDRDICNENNEAPTRSGSPRQLLLLKSLEVHYLIVQIKFYTIIIIHTLYTWLIYSEN